MTPPAKETDDAFNVVPVALLPEPDSIIQQKR